MEFSVEGTNGTFSGLTVENMESDDGAAEIHYVYDDTGEIMASDDFSNITDLVLEDGTRAMIVNGTLVTANGQTLILQDGSDLSQYSVDDNTDEIVISKEQEDQFLEIMAPHVNQNEDPNVIHYIQDDSGDITIKTEPEQIFYIQDGENMLPVQEQYQIAELDSQDSNEPMQVIQLGNEPIFDELGGVIDLEQLLLGQQGSVQLEGAHEYQYAVLQDGKFHLQSASSPIKILSAEDLGAKVDQAVLDQSTDLISSDFLDLSAIKGRNVQTGQVITLSRNMDKSLNKKNKTDYNSNKKDIIMPKFDERKKTVNTTNSLRKLINKKITIGQTDKGKMLVGKIVNVMKKADANINRNKVNNGNIEKKTVPPPRRKLTEISKLPIEELIDLVDDERSTLTKGVQSKIPTTKNAASLNKKKLTNNESIRSVLPDPHKIRVNNMIKIIGNSNTNLETSKRTSTSGNKVKKSGKKRGSSEGSLKTTNQESLENSQEQSKIIVHKKLVTKDCFDVIIRTVIGLMNMDSVVKKLINRTIIIKVIEKTYNRHTNDYSKTISYCCGYVVREYKVDDESNSVSEAWTFIPDNNSKETILGQEKLKTRAENGSNTQEDLKKIANLTIQITINPEGKKTTRVIVNPPALFKCKACTKSFRTSALLKVHSLKCQPSFKWLYERTGLESPEPEEKEQTSTGDANNTNNTKGMYECMLCNHCFSTPLQIRQHIDMHYKGDVLFECPLCKASFSSLMELNKHLSTHADSPESRANSVLEQDGANIKPPERKVFSCNVCSRQFSRHSNLQRHMDIHQGEGAMYQCAVCSCSYHYISSLTRHVVSCHIDKSKKIPPGSNSDQDFHPRASTSPHASSTVNQDNGDNLQFLEDDQIVQMIPLEQMSQENLQQYVSENLEYVTEDFQGSGDEVQILQISEDSSIIIKD